MNQLTRDYPLRDAHPSGDVTATSLESGSPVSWGAILAGASATAAFSLSLLVLGSGLGLAAVSPWVSVGIRAITFGLSAVLWITMTQLVSSGLGGYLTGRCGWSFRFDRSVRREPGRHLRRAWSRS